MESRQADEVTNLLLAWQAGDEGALKDLTGLVYQTCAGPPTVTCCANVPRIPFRLRLLSMRSICAWWALGASLQRLPHPMERC
jgi:hypothetical protein